MGRTIMNLEKLSLSWKEYDVWTSKTFKELKDDKSYVDVTLAAGDKQLKAHKIILSSCSSFFRRVFQSSDHQMTFIYLKGVASHHLEAILNFIYIGEAEISSNEVEQFLEAAEVLEIQGLVKTECNEAAEKGAKSEPTDNHQYERVLPEMKPFPSSTWWHDDTEASNSLVIDEFKTEDELYNYDTGDITVPNFQTGLYQCDECGYTSARKDSVKNHKLVVHQGIKFPCNKCSYQASYKSHLTRHIQSVHDGVRYPCDLCDFKATQQVHLREHKVSRHAVADNIQPFI